MTPGQRYFPRLVQLVARAYGISVDTLTDDVTGPVRLQARRVTYLIAATTLDLTNEQIGTAMQRNRHTIWHQLKRARSECRRKPIVASTVLQVTARVVEELRATDVLAAEAAE